MRALQILTAALVGIAVITAVAHALELPGKRRLSRDTYFAVQQIYYPGFTVAGIAEPAALASADHRSAAGKPDKFGSAPADARRLYPRR